MQYDVTPIIDDYKDRKCEQHVKKKNAVNTYIEPTDYCIQIKRLTGPLPDDKILDWSKLKQIPDDILKCIYNEK